MIDAVVIGAGMAGLVCAQQIQQAGYGVVVIEKSRGLGGRIATRRLQGTCADHGVRCLEAQGTLSQQLIQKLCNEGILVPWMNETYEMTPTVQLHGSTQTESCYAAPTGMTAVAKFLAVGLEIQRSQRVQSITTNPDQTWALTLESAEAKPLPELIAKAIAIAIPAPQAVTLLEPLTDQGLPAAFLTGLRSVEFEPCLSAIAAYPSEQPSSATNHFTKRVTQLPWKAVTFPHDPDLDWIGLDSSKRQNSQPPVFVIQSSAAFARHYLEVADLYPAGKRLLSRAAELLLPWLDVPIELQVHRWRYAFVSHPWQEPFLATPTPLPLVCSGDWCGGNQIESALRSGLTAAMWTIAQLQAAPMPAISDEAKFADLIRKLL